MRNYNKSDMVARRAWRILRVALLWARKGDILKNRLMLAKHLMKNIKNSTHHRFHLHRNHRGAAIGYGERELSFDDTPVIHVKMHRPSSMRFKMPNIPCINPPAVDFDYDFDDEDEEDREYGYGGDYVEKKVEEMESGRSSTSSDQSDEEIDLKAEVFINNFYKQMKLQRQISYLQYNEMINRGAN